MAQGHAGFFGGFFLQTFQGLRGAQVCAEQLQRRKDPRLKVWEKVLLISHTRWRRRSWHACMGVWADRRVL